LEIKNSRKNDYGQKEQINLERNDTARKVDEFKNYHRYKHRKKLPFHFVLEIKNSFNSRKMIIEQINPESKREDTARKDDGFNL
jgi:hypothetical protein